MKTHPGHMDVSVQTTELKAGECEASPEVAAYPFTTREPYAGMMEWEDVRIQLIDTPPITADFLESYLQSMVQTADAAILMVDLADDDGPFAAQTRLGHAGSIPVNTGGGELSSYYMWGMTPLSEAIIQARGQAGERQADQHGLVLVSGNGGVLDHNSTLVLSSEQP